MANKYKSAVRAVMREARALERDYRGLRGELGRLRRKETALWRRVEKLARSGKPSHLRIVEHRPGRKARISHYPLSSPRSFLVLAQRAGTSGLFCGCRPILTAPQRDGSLDVCILIRCSNEPEKTGFQCEYWCFTVEQPPVVAVAKKRTTRRGRSGT